MIPALRLETPPLSARVSAETIASTLARLIASGAATTKADLGRTTGLSRSTIDTGLRTLFDLGALRVSGLQTVHGRGRPGESLEISADFGAVLVIDCGVGCMRLSVFDLGQRLLDHATIELPIASGPQRVLDAVIRQARSMLAQDDGANRHLVTVLGLPGPVDDRHGSVVRPPIMPGWDGFEVADYVRRGLGGFVVLENDVNLRALGEARAAEGCRGPSVFIEIGSGIGAGIVTGDGMLLHGADGAAGDIGHIPVPGGSQPCVCGNVGCLEAVASIAALARDSADLVGVGEDAEARVIELVRERHPDALRRAEAAAEAIGDVLVALVHLCNPSRIVIGGALAEATDDVLSVIRSRVYRRALPLAARNLTIALSSLGGEAGTAGGYVLGAEHAFDPCALGALIERCRPSFAQLAGFQRTMLHAVSQ